MDRSRTAARAGFVAVTLSAALVVVAVAVAPFLSSGWVAFEQSRSGAAALTGYSTADLRTVTDAILADLVVGPPDFDVELDGAPVLTATERSHMRDVRGVFSGFFLVAAVALAFLVAAFAYASRGGRSRRDVWRAVRRGALGLAVATIGAGVIALVAFDAAFEVFHRLFFADGTYLFDPATSRLVQLFPFAFWSETSIAVGGVIVALAAGCAWFAGRRLSAGERPAADAGADHPGLTESACRASEQGSAR
ncbi:MAG: DUF1461 domain-containing protein [Chloroflexi bacterium]|nr:DUF1461 domain-containing protein [Chloroflexota bacterium]